VQSDESTPYVKQASPTMDFAELWETPSVPPAADPSYDAAANAPEGLEPTDPNGALFRVVCLAPDPPDFDVVATMHSTRTIDCVIVVSGVVTAVFEDGSEVDLHPGDSLVHRGVPHAWSNRGTEPCVFYDVMISALDHAPEAS
jgi:mannose-6-phosphate isomerase-like protein (cupin superfamily)